MTTTVHVSFPAAPDAYPAEPHWHAQLCSFIFKALQARFGERVAFCPWDRMPPLRAADALVTFLPHPALPRWKRTVLIDNDAFDVDKWRYAAFRRYGYDAPLDPVAGPYAALRGQFHRVVLCNDVTLRRVAARDAQVADCWDYLHDLAGGRVSLHPHPIDKAYFSRLFQEGVAPDRARMLVYHGGPRKNSAELIALLRAQGYEENKDFSVVKYVDKKNEDLLRFLRQNFLFVANTSFSETGPINMWEYMTAGHLIYGHEEWWDGAGEPGLCWSYDPARAADNAAALDYRLRRADMNTLLAERDRIRGWWMERTDNEWSAVAGDVVQRVDDLLSGTFPAFGR
jgi:hypothetical protein